MWRKPWVHRIALLAIFFAAIAPTAPWVEFSGGMENFNVATALESQRNDTWVIPTLYGQPRTAKPPLTHWITAAGIRSSNSLGWGARWPSVLMGCLMLVAVYELGRALRDETLGLIGALVCGTTLIFLKFAWQASYDLQLALWVTVANVFLARAVWKNQLWLGCLGAGTALGLAIMTKGPVALLQTVAPLVVLGGGLWWSGRKVTDAPASRAMSVVRKWAPPIVAGVAVLLLISLPWPLYVIFHTDRSWGHWFGEVTLKVEAGYDNRIKWHTYLVIFLPMMLPWAVWFVAGMVRILRDRPRSPRLLALVCWVFIPIVVMAFFPEQRDRYLLPMYAAVSLIAAYGLIEDVPTWGTWNRGQGWLLGLHAVEILTIALGLPLAGAAVMKTVGGTPWYPPALALVAVLVVAALAILTLRLYRRTPAAVVAGTAALMLVTQALFLWGYKDSDSGRSEGKVFVDQILSRYPNAIVYNARPDRRAFPLEVLIYLNRDVTPTTDPADLRPLAAPQVIVYPPDEAHPTNVDTPPAGFAPVAEQKINTGIWRAYALPPSKDALATGR